MHIYEYKCIKWTYAGLSSLAHTGHLPAYALQAAAAPDWRTLVSAQAGQETSADARSFLQELQ
jgi:hypothetical protein